MTAPVRRAAARDDLTAAHSDAQAVIAAWVEAEMARVWPALDSSRLDDTGPLWVRLALEVIQSGRRQSAAVSGAWHAADRAVALSSRNADDLVTQFGGACNQMSAATGRRLPPSAERYAAPARNVDIPPMNEQHPSPALDRREARASLLVTGPVTIKRTQDEQRAERKARKAASRHALNGGRELVHNEIRSDPRARGWIRVPDGDPCAFCLMLASRTDIYNTESAARFTRRSGGKDQYHDGCGCQPRPVYSLRDERPEANRRAEQLWKDATAGKAGNAARIAFRQAVEGRQPPERESA